MTALLIALNILAGLFLIGVVLLQSGKGADMGAAFGGASSTVFGASGAGNLLTKLTAATATLFMGTSLALAVISTRDRSVFDDMSDPAPRGVTAPAAVPPDAAVPPAEGAASDGAPDQPFAATDGIDAKAPAEARGQQPLVADDTDTAGSAAGDLGPAGQAGAATGGAADAQGSPAAADAPPASNAAGMAGDADAPAAQDNGAGEAGAATDDAAAPAAPADAAGGAGVPAADENAAGAAGGADGAADDAPAADAPADDAPAGAAEAPAAP